LHPGWDIEGTEHGDAYIVGRVKNQSSKQYRYVRTALTLCDADGALVGTASANVVHPNP
jgi:hypothetical protein